MKASTAVLCGVLLLPLLASAAGADRDTVVFGCFMETDFMLTTTPSGSVPIPDGTPVRIYWDVNANGPDASDTLLPLCDDPPDCPTGPAGSFNLNTFPMDGGWMFGQEGYFYMDPCLAPAEMWPTPDRIYFRVVHPAIVWTSNVVTLVIGPQEEELETWTPMTLPLPCAPPDTLTILPIPGGQYGSVDTCLCLSSAVAGRMHEILVGPFPSRCVQQYPNGIVGPITITSGCPGSDCVPASNWICDQGAWGWVTVDGQYYDRLRVSLPLLNGGGCVHVHLDLMSGNDCWLPVTFGQFSALPMDNAVRLSWNTLSETNVARFEILRDGTWIHSEDATNTSTEHRYEFVDRGAQNGTTYTYELAMVNGNGSRELLATQSAAPSAQNAIVAQYALHQNFPNPFNPTTSIAIDLMENGNVSLRVYNLMGQEVASLVSGNMDKGRHIVSFDATNFPSGVYLYRMSVKGFVAEKKMLLMK